MRPLVAGYYSRIEDRRVPMFIKVGVKGAEILCGPASIDRVSFHQWLSTHTILFSGTAPRETRVTLAQSQFFLSMVGKSISEIP